MSRSFRRHSVAPAYIARDVRVEPAHAEQDKLPLGGICWEGQEDPPDAAHHLRGRRPADLPFTVSDVDPARLTGRYVWGGYAVAHFGHFVAEQSTRLLKSGLYQPPLKLLVLLPPRATLDDVPRWQADVLRWHGFDRDRVVYVDKPVVVDELVVFPQEEHLVVGPGEEYLDLLDWHTRPFRASRRMSSIPTYVSRAGVPGGALGGEGYLETALRKLGVNVVRPESLSVEEQLALYAQSKTLIFAEGSAVHGRQLLGRLRQSLSILVRRKGSRFAGRMMSPRVSELDYLDGIVCSVHFSYDPRTGSPKRWESFPFSDGEQLVREFTRIGLDLAPVWDNAAFEKQVEADLIAWATRVSRSAASQDTAERVRLLAGSLYGVGLERYAPSLTEVALRIDRERR